MAMNDEERDGGDDDDGDDDDNDDDDDDDDNDDGVSCWDQDTNSTDDRKLVITADHCNMDG
jgi:hypothetical protein